MLTVVGENMRVQSSEITWYEDGFLIEWWINDSIKPEDKRCEHGSLKEAIEIARDNEIILYIQPAFQDQTLIVDFSEEEIDYKQKYENLVDSIKLLKGEISTETFENILEDMI